MNKIIHFLLFFGWVISLPGQMVEIHHIDVGTGDATLIKVNNRVPARAILIDAGYKGLAPNVIQYMQTDGLGGLGGNPYIDFVIASHYHQDHIGGLVGPKRKVGFGFQLLSISH